MFGDPLLQNFCYLIFKVHTENHRAATSGGTSYRPLTFSLPNFPAKFPHFFKNSPLSRHKRRISSIGRQREDSFFNPLLTNWEIFLDLNERIWNFLSTNQLGKFCRKFKADFVNFLWTKRWLWLMQRLPRLLWIWMPTCDGVFRSFFEFFLKMQKRRSQRI